VDSGAGKVHCMTGQWASFAAFETNNLSSLLFKPKKEIKRTKRSIVAMFINEKG